MIFSNHRSNISTQIISDHAHYYFLTYDHPEANVKLSMPSAELLLSIQASLHHNYKVYLLGERAQLKEFYQLEKKISLNHFHLEFDILLLLPSLKKRFLPTKTELEDLILDLKTVSKWLK